MYTGVQDLKWLTTGKIFLKLLLTWFVFEIFRWSVGWGDYLVTSRNIIYASIDGRGTGYQSDEHKFQVYRNLGTVEMDDQIAVARKLSETYSYIDANKVAIWGWSYGGFATAMTMEQDSGPSPVFSCGISGHLS